MPEWNLVEAQETERAFKPSVILGLIRLAQRPVVVSCLFFAALVLASQTGCTKIRGGGLDRNILRAGNNTVPSQQSRPVAPARFSNDPTTALSELNDAWEKFEGQPANGESQHNDAKILDGAQTFETEQKDITLVAVQPPAPSIKHSFEVAQGSSSVNAKQVLLGGVPLSEIEPINPAKVIAQCSHEHEQCDCLKEKLKPVLPFARPIPPPAVSSQAPPSELVSQPLAPIMFDQTTREVQAYDQQQAKTNALRVLGQRLAENSAPLEEKIETPIVPQPSKFAHADASPMHFHPVVDPELGRANKLLQNSCGQCDSLACIGDCQASKRRADNNQLRPIVASEPTKAIVSSPVIQTPRRAPIKIKGEFVSSPKALPVSRVNYSEFTTEDWTEIFGPPEVPVKPQLQAKLRRSEFQPKLPVSPPSVQENHFQVIGSNDFSPNNNVELVVAEVPTEGTKWEPPKHTNFSPIPPADFKVPVLEKAPLREIETPFPVVDTRVEVPPPKPEVIIEIVDNTVPWSVKLAETVDNVRRQLDAEHDPMTRNGIAVNLRLLEVLQSQMETVEESRHSMPNSELQYWQHQLDAIALMLPATHNGVSDLDRHNTAYETLEHLRKAVERLESIAELKVTSGKFCTEISGFGKYQPFANSVFKPGQKTLVYCEVENYLSSARVINSDQSYLTRLRGSYVVYDQQGRVVQQMEYPVVDDVARKKRRDFYMYFPIQIGELAVGNYRLELMVEDLSSNKTAALKPGMAFQVR